MESLPNSTETTPPGAGGKLPLRSKLAYGVGGFAEHFTNNVPAIMASPILNVTLGVSPVLIGIALGVPRILDAFVDPVVGVLSDRTRSRFGRRKPYMIVGGLLSAILAAALWLIPQGWSEMNVFLFFCIGLVVLYSVYPVFAIPYAALGYEMTPDYGERTNLQAFRAVFGFLSSFLISWMLWVTQWDIFSSTVEGMQWVMFASVPVLMACALAPVIFCKETHIRTAIQKVRLPLKTTLAAPFQCPPFLLVSGARLSVICGIMLVMQLGIYINIYYVFDGSIKEASLVGGTVNTVFQVLSIALIPVIAWFANRLGKRQVLLALLVPAAMASAAKWFCYRPDMPYLQLLPVIIFAPGLSAIWSLTYSMTADVCDYDEFRHGERREGTFAAIIGWGDKLAISISLLLAGFLLSATGFDAKIEGPQSASTIVYLRLLDSTVTATGILLACGLLAFYPLSKTKMARIRRILEHRRGRG